MSEKHKSPLPFIKDIMDSIEKIEKYCQNITYDQFLQDDKTKDAVVRNLEVIGRKLYDTIKAKEETGLPS